jgi:Protein of unknown function (DUF3073)
MGRGRAKAKQTKVARRLKYSGPDTDFQRLAAELRGSEHESEEEYEDDPYADDPYADDPYAKYLDDDEDDEDEDDTRP